MVTKYARRTLEIKPRIAMERAAFNRKRKLFTSKFDVQLRIEREK
jgi:hypothetical protein